MNFAPLAVAAPLLAAALLASVPAAAQGVPGPAPRSTGPVAPVRAATDPDPWLGPDKVLHFSASAALAAGGYGVGTLTIDDLAGRIALGAAIALGAGIAKEALDATGFGNPSWKDFTWDVIGTAAGLSVSFTIDIAVSAPRR